MTETKDDLLMKVVSTFNLPDGTLVGVGLVGPEDEKRLVSGFKKLSLQTKMYRFNCGKNELSRKEKDYLLNIDNHDHFAIGAVDLNGSHDVGIGVIRYIRYKTESGKAEVAITIIDEYQNKGIGTFLYKEMLGYASRNNIRILENFVLKENRVMIRVLEKIGGEIKEDCGNQYRIEVNVPENC